MNRRAFGEARRATSPAVLAFLTRGFGLLLSAIAVQLVVDGVRSLT